MPEITPQDILQVTIAGIRGGTMLEAAVLISQQLKAASDAAAKLDEALAAANAVHNSTPSDAEDWVRPEDTAVVSNAQAYLQAEAGFLAVIMAYLSEVRPTLEITDIGDLFGLDDATPSGPAGGSGLSDFFPKTPPKV